MKKILAGFIILLIIGVGYIYYTIYIPVDSNDTENISFVIDRGSSVNEVTNELKEEGLIKCKISFYGYVRLYGFDTKITAGRYVLNKSMDVPEILETIMTPTLSETVVTIQEGLTISDIDDKLTELTLVQDGEFEAAVKQFNEYETYDFLDREKIEDLEFPLEGYLYPDTYYVDAIDFNSNRLIEKMLNNFETKFATVEDLFDAQDKSLHDIITMSSILQREVRTEKDLAIVAGILWKRFDSGWHIGADATILYVTKKKTIDVEDLEVDSPYNTRLHVGMPPGPISNPDIEHIEASIMPEDSDYWYYLTTLDTGEVIYGRNNDEHNTNKAKYLY
ncbi:endolytic transglycosylase MltG [Patescibacteria group bacterium]